MNLKKSEIYICMCNDAYILSRVDVFTSIQSWRMCITCIRQLIELLIRANTGILHQIYANILTEHRMSQWLRHTTVDRSAPVWDLAWANECISSGYWTRLRPISIQQYSSKPLSWLKKLIVLYVDSDRRGFSLRGHWHQRFEHALSWDIVTRCNLSRPKFNTTKWVWFQIPSHTSLPEHRGNKIYISNIYLCSKKKFAFTCHFYWHFFFLESSETYAKKCK